MAASPLMRRLNGVLGLLIGLFGALAILGVFFKIAKYPNYEIFMAVGFFGEAAAFVIMGLFSLINGFSGKRGEEGRAAGDGAAVPAMSGAAFEEALREASDELRGELRTLVRQGFAQNLQTLTEAVRRDVELFGEEMRELGTEMQNARHSVHAMRMELDRVASGQLPADAEQLGRGMRQLADGMADAGAAVEQMRADLREMALRFHAFNGDGRTLPHNGDIDGVMISAKKGSRTEVAR